MSIRAGTVLEATTASGDTVRVRALRAPERGRDFPVVWVATETEYERAKALGREPDGLPWPLDAVVVVEREGVADEVGDARRGLGWDPIRRAPAT